jgi:UDP-N-acetylmuramate--alanine ligase
VAGKTELVFVEDIADMPDVLLKMARDGDVVMTMGAGSIAGVPAQLQQLAQASPARRQA